MKEQETNDRESKANQVQTPSRGEGDETAGPKSSVAPVSGIGEDTVIADLNLNAIASFIYGRYPILAMADGDGSHLLRILNDAGPKATGHRQVSDLFPLCERVESGMIAHYASLLRRDAVGSDGVRLSDKVVRECWDRGLLFVFDHKGCTVLDDITAMATSMRWRTLVEKVLPYCGEDVCDEDLVDEVFIDKLATALVDEWEAQQAQQRRRLIFGDIPAGRGRR